MNAGQPLLRQFSAPRLPAVVRSSVNPSFWPAAGIVLVLGLQLVLVFTRAINWDEFYHFTQVHRFTAGLIDQPVQTFYTQLFSWLPGLTGSDVNDLIMARTVMFACELVAAAALAMIAARFSDRTVALLCALSYVSAGFVLQHGFSFRVDPMVAALLMSALCLMLYTRLRIGSLLAIAAMVALAAMITIKVVLYAPAFLGVMWLRWREQDYRPAFLLRPLALGVIAGAIFAALYSYHATVVQADAIGSGQTYLAVSATKMFQLGVPVYWKFIVKAALFAPLLTILILLAPFAIRRSELSMPLKITACALLVPIATLAFYHNTAPYFYAFILPPVVAACAVPMAMAVRRYGAAPLAALLVSGAILIWSGEDREVLDRQRALIRAADTIFPEQVAYLDFCGMLVRHAKANVFMTPWGIELYHQGREPTVRDILRESTVPLLVENDMMYARLLRTDQETPEFLPEDAALMRRTYQHFWGPFWVAGAIVPAGASRQPVAISVPGPYTVSGAPITLAGRFYAPGAVINLPRGSYSISAAGSEDARLTWGKHLRKPAGLPPPEPHWTGF